MCFHGRHSSSSCLASRKAETQRKQSWTMEVAVKVLHSCVSRTTAGSNRKRFPTGRKKAPNSGRYPAPGTVTRSTTRPRWKRAVSLPRQTTGKTVAARLTVKSFGARSSQSALPSRYLRRPQKQACRHDSSTTMEAVFTAGPCYRIVKNESVSPEGCLEGAEFNSQLAPSFFGTPIVLMLCFFVSEELDLLEISRSEFNIIRIINAFTPQMS